MDRERERERASGQLSHSAGQAKETRRHPPREFAKYPPRASEVVYFELKIRKCGYCRIRISTLKRKTQERLQNVLLLYINVEIKNMHIT